MSAMASGQGANRFRASPALLRLRHGTGPAAATRATGLTAMYHQRFREASGDLLAAERFDAAAAKLYCGATNPPILADQSAAIRRLLQRRRSTSSPLVTSYEEQDPHFGRWVLSTLVLEEYGEFKIANNSDIRVNNPPTTLPPQNFRIHLCWGVGWEGAPAAWALHGVVALLAEDWRAALSRLPVRLELHRLAPKPLSIRVERGRRRWRELDPPLPSSAAIAALFERANRAEALAPWRIDSSQDDTLNGNRSTNNWWCLCLLQSDLPRLGFTRGADPLPGTRGAAWSAARHALPDAIEHVIAVPPAPDRGTTYSVRLQGDTMSLEPARHARGDVDVTDYWQLRVSALDLVLDELSSRMH